VAPADPGHLVQASYRVGQVLQHLGGDHHVELAVTERQLVGAGVQEPGPR
jgi:hypothetical protein